MRIRQNNTMLVRLKAWLGKDMKVKTAVCTCTAITCAVALTVGGVTYAASVHSAAVREVAQSMASDNKDYAKLIKKYNSLVDEYNGIADEYNDAKDAIAEADNVKSGIKDLNSQHDELQKKVDEKKAELQSLTGQVEQAKRNSISDGVWQVGKDIDAGTYRASDSVTDRCYWEISSGGNILQNDIPGGGYPQVTVSDGQQFKLQNCGTFTKQ